jgi:large subunit ribosomal protein L13
MKTYAVKADEVKKDWYVVDAAGQTLGRLASRIAAVLIGKHKPTYSPNVDVGDFVVVLNADKFVLTGKKWQDKKYYRHSGFQGHLRVEAARDVHKKFPDRLLRLAVSGMLPKNRLRDVRLRKLKLYTGTEHPHAAQQPRPLPLEGPVA